MVRVTFRWIPLLWFIIAAPVALAGPIEDLQPGQWYEAPNSHLNTVLPSPVPYGDPASIMIAWSGGAYDTQRNRLLVLGGGHADYGGNEVYAFDIGTLRWSRIWGPSPSIPPPGACNLTYSDGNPASRHNYDAVEYLPNQDRLHLQGGSLFCSSGNAGPDTWSLSLSAGTWTRRADMPNQGGQLELTTAYDPVTGHLFCAGPASFNDLMEYDPVANTWTTKGDQGAGYGQVGAIDPVRRKYITLGNGGPVYIWNIGGSGTVPRATLATSGDKSMEAERYPGIDFDPVSNLLVAWGGGGSVYTLNVSTGVWTKRTPVGSVLPTSPPSQGTYGRFRYIPSKNVFIVANHIDENVFFYKLAAGGGSPPDSISPSRTSDLTPR